MKSLLIAIATVFALQGAFAQENIPAARTLQAVMKEMGPKFKSLGQQIADPTKNASSTELIRELAALSQEALSLRPTKIATLPLADQRASELRYLRMMLELELQAIDAEEALIANNQTAAIEAVKQMGALRGSGHDEFRE